MPEKSKTKAKSTKKSRLFRVGFALSLFAVALCTVVLLFWLATRALFSKNRHFTLKYVQVQSGGRWDRASKRVIGILNVSPGKTNLFEINLRNVRKALEAEPSIEKVTAARVLPDTLKLEIVERIPRAFLSSSKSNWVIDSSCVVMSRQTCINLGKDMPIIAYREGRRKLRAGLELPKLKPAMDLIMLSNTDYPEFKIVAIKLEEQKELTFFMQYKGKKSRGYKVIMPPYNLRYYLRVLKSALLRAIRSGDPRRTINLMYKNSVIMSGNKINGGHICRNC